jgi:hypothetical protein
MTAPATAAINRENATHSTGPVTAEGKQTACMNAFKHGLTGQRLMLQPHEIEPYRNLTAGLNAEHNPKTETERQLVQHIVDCHARLNRIAAMDNNILNLSLFENSFPLKEIESTPENNAETISVIAQSRAWLEQCDALEKLGRYEARISRQLLRYTKELDRVQRVGGDNQEEPAAAATAPPETKPVETTPDTPPMASFRKSPFVNPVPSPAPRSEYGPAPVIAIKSFQQQ